MCLKKSIWVFHLLLFSAVASAQNYSAQRSDASKSYWKGYVHPIHTPFSAEASVGTAVYTGELSSPKDGSLQNGYKNLAYGVGVDYRLTNYIKVGLKAKRFRLASESDPEFWNERSFSTKNMQYSINVEHNLFPHSDLEDLDRRVNLYFTLGIGINRYQVSVKDPPLEQVADVKESTMVIPLGLGVSFYLNQTAHIALEGHYYATSSDNLDGTFLGTGSGGKNDGYIIFELKYSWQIANGFVYKNHIKRKRM